MLQKLDLQKYEKNLRKGMLTDSTLHLVNDRFVTITYNHYLLLFRRPSLDAWRYFHGKALLYATLTASATRCPLTLEDLFFCALCSALRDVQIPPGPRLLILDYLKK